MRWLFLLLLLPHLAFAAASNFYTSPRDTVRLVSASNAAPGGTLHLALEFLLQPGWHIYWQNPGDAGFAPQLSPQPPVSFGALQFPPPELLLQGPVGAYVLSGHVLLPFTAQNVAGSVAARAAWLVCADICVPEHAVFLLPLPGGVSAEAGLFTPSAIVPSPFAATLAPDGTLRVAGLGPAQVRTAHFFPLAPGGIVNAAPQSLSFNADGLALNLTLAQPGAEMAGVLELTDPSGQMQALSLTPTPAAMPGHAPYWALALLGGLILNLMPCVFPILALKTCAFAQLGGAAHGHIRREALAYAAGVMLSMLTLAAVLLGLRAAGGADIFWGFQFQSPVFVALAAWVVFAAALSLAGLFHFNPPRFLSRIPAQNSFATGLLAVVLATPCTAPFMAPAVAAALALPALPALEIFAALGLGLAAPILLLAFIPRLAAGLPRPGAWMLWLQRVLALPMLGTFVWLGWVLFRQSGPDGVMLLLLGAVVLLITLWRQPLAAILVVLLLPFLHAAPAAALTLPGAAPYSAALLQSLRAEGRPVFVDLTAAWCVTCLVNEHGALLSPGVQTAFAANHVAVLVGDWTSRDAAITALLAQNHRAGVPLYLYYPPGGGPKILPQILTPGVVEQALTP